MQLVAHAVRSRTRLSCFWEAVRSLSFSLSGSSLRVL